MDVSVGLERKLSTEELMLLNWGVGEDSWESLGLQEIQPVHPKGNQSWIVIGRADAETPILWPPDAKKWLNGKDRDAGKDWRQEEKGMAEDEMVGWHHRLNGHEFEQALGVGDGQRGLACCSSWGHKESDMTEQLNWTKLNLSICFPVQHLLSKCSVLELCSSVFLRGSVPIQETILGGNKKHLDWLLFMSSLNLNNVLPHVPSSSSFFLFNRY